MPFASDGRTAFAPLRQLGDEVRRAGELDVDAERLLQPRDLSQQLVGVRLESNVDVDRGCTPALENRGRAACKVKPGRIGGGISRFPRKRQDIVGVSARPRARPRGRS